MATNENVDRVSRPVFLDKDIDTLLRAEVFSKKKSMSMLLNEYLRLGMKAAEKLNKGKKDTEE